MNETVDSLGLIVDDIKKLLYHLPIGAQKVLRKTMLDVCNIFMHKKNIETSLVEALPDWTPGQSIKVDNMHLEYIAKHDIAKQFDRRWASQHEIMSQFVPLATYKWYVSIGDLSIPFQLDMHITLQDRTGKRQDKIMYVLWYNKDTWSHIITKDNIIPKTATKALNKAVLETIASHYDIKNYLFDGSFRRAPIKINNPLDISSMKQAEYNLFRSVKEKNHIPPTALYDQEGSDLYRKVTLSPEYSKMVEQETDMIKENITKIAPYVGENTNIVDLGAGSGEKVVALIRSLISQQDDKDKPYNYIATDSSMYTLLHLWQTKSNVNSDGNIHFNLRRNLIEDSNEFKKLTWKTITFLWGTLGNYEQPERELIAKKIIDSLWENEAAMVSVFLVDENKTEEEMTNPYQNEISKRFTFRILDKMWRHTNVIDYKPRYNKENTTVILEWVFAEPQLISYKDMNISKKPGETITLSISHLFSPKEIQELFESQGGEIKEAFTKNNSYMFIVQKAL